MSILRFDPFREVTKTGDELDRFFDHFFKRGFFERKLAPSRFLPLVNVSEDENHLYFRFDMPGIEKKELKVTVQNNTLTVKGERRSETKTEKENYHLQELEYGTFERSFLLPSTIDESKVEANYKDGILTVVIHKKEESKAREVEIK